MAVRPHCLGGMVSGESLVLYSVAGVGGVLAPSAAPTRASHPQAVQAQCLGSAVPTVLNDGAIDMYFLWDIHGVLEVPGCQYRQPADLPWHDPAGGWAGASGSWPPSSQVPLRAHLVFSCNWINHVAQLSQFGLALSELGVDGK